MDPRLETHVPRENWKERVENSGLLWHGHDGDSYWGEGSNIAITLKNAEILETAANELHEMSLDACEEILRRGWLPRLGLPEHTHSVIEQSWSNRDPHLYGRFDLAWTGRGEPKLLEYNADTPTSLLEAAIIQWEWLQDLHPGGDQLNSLHEALLEEWEKPGLPDHVHFTCAGESLEDRQTIAYLAETCEQTGKQVTLLDISELGLNSRQEFTDLDENPIEKIFKLYPWEWMADEPFFRAVHNQTRTFLEPPWKMMLSTKKLLPILWELHPGHPYLLPAFDNVKDIHRKNIAKWVEKPAFGREGAGVGIHHYGQTVAKAPAPIKPGEMVYQAHADLFQQQNRHFVWGLWIIGDECRGMSVRSDESAITGNCSRFHPHRLI